MYGILVSALNTALGFILKGIIVKFVLFFGLYYVVSEFIEYLSTKLPTFSGLPAELSEMPSGLWYFLDLFQISPGISICISAALLRFMIRRIPLIG